MCIIVHLIVSTAIMTQLNLSLDLNECLEYQERLSTILSHTPDPVLERLSDKISALLTAYDAGNLSSSAPSNPSAAVVTTSTTSRKRTTSTSMDLTAKNPKRAKNIRNDSRRRVRVDDTHLTPRNLSSVVMEDESEDDQDQEEEESKCHSHS